MERIMDNARVVVTGLGVVSPNGIGIRDFRMALKKARSGIRKFRDLQELGFRCQVAGIPPINSTEIRLFLEKYRIPEIISSGVLYGLWAAVEAWSNAGLKIEDGYIHSNTGCIFGTGSNGAESTAKIIDMMDDERHDEWHKGSREAIQCMASAVSIYISKVLGIGSFVTTLSSACSTGTEGLLQGYDAIRQGLADRALVGSSESASPYVWSPFDAMFATASGRNRYPTQTSAPLSAEASGFVPSAGAGALVLERLDIALERGASIYGEILGGFINSGGQRGGGSMTLGNPDGMVRCIKGALKNTKVAPKDIDLISGHLTSTIGDVYEIKSWARALELSGTAFPYINAPKSLIGHSLSASGAIEAVAAILQLNDGFVHASRNAFPLHPEIASIVDSSKVPVKTLRKALNVVAKISLGFGDVNACILFKKWNG
ncbi:MULTISPECIES: beta-ketoacyl-[acyl-carrier-protein] synthase family protein [Chitinophagaceae]